MTNMFIDSFSNGVKRIMFFIFIIALTLRIFSIATVAFFKGITGPDDHEYGVIARSLIKGHGYSVPVLESLGERDKASPKIGNYFFYLRSNEPREKDNLANLMANLKETGQYRPTGDQLPVYPIVLAVVYHLFDSHLSSWIIKFIQAIFSSVTCVIIYLVALKLFSQRVATIAGFISVIYPVFIFNTQSIIPETLFTFWLALSVLYLIRLKQTLYLKHQVIVGILIGITLLISNVAVPMVPFVGIWLLTLNGTWDERFKRFLMVMATAFLIVSPWLARNYIAFREFPLMKTSAGINFWLGNNPDATGTFFQQSGERMEFNLPKPAPEDFNLSETEQDKKLYNEAMTYVKDNPMHFARLFLKKLYYFLWFPPDNLMSTEGRLYKKLFKVPYGFILMSGAAGVILFLRRNAKETFLLCAIIFSVVVLYAIFIVGHIRYRMPIEPYMILFAAFAIGSLFDKYSRRHCK